MASLPSKTFEYAQFDPTKVLFGKKPTKGARANVPIKYGDMSTTMRWQTPMQTAPFGVSMYDGNSKAGGGSATQANNSGKNSYKLVLNATDPAYVAFCAQLDECVIQAAVKNSVEWFGARKSRDLILEKYVPLLKPGKGEYPPTNKFTVVTSGEMKTAFFLSSAALVPYTDLPSHSSTAAIVEGLNIYFFGPSFGLTVVTRQVLFRPPANNAFGFDTSSVEIQEAIAENEEQGLPQSMETESSEEENPDAHLIAAAMSDM